MFLMHFIEICILMLPKIFLAITGTLYLLLAIWCSISPKVTSEKVGFELMRGSGQSEFLVVYGGLEFGLALLFLLPILRAEYLQSSMLACVLIHGSLVAFRTCSFFLFSEISPMTYSLAVGEWLIFLSGLGCCYYLKFES